jgi:tricorn protease interacting factor F2/3
LKKEKTKDTWMIPVSVSFDDKKTYVLLDKLSSKIKKESDFYKLNEGQFGFYRVKYPAAALNDLRTKIKQFSNIDRWGIQGDFYALCKSGDAATKDYLALAEAYKGDDDFLVCSDIQANLASFYYNSYYENFNSQIVEYNKKFLKEIFDKLGWEPKKGEKHTTPMLRAQTISFLGKLGDETIIAEAKKRFDIYVKQKKLSPDLQSAVFNMMAWYGDEKLYNTFRELYKKTETQEEKIRFLGAISSFKDKALLQRTFDFILSDEIRYSDMIYPLAYLAGNPAAKPMLWPWAKTNWKQLEKRLGETKMLLRRVINNLAVLSDDASEKDIRAFFKKNPTKGIKMSLAQTLEKISINIDYMKRMRKEFS